MIYLYSVTEARVPSVGFSRRPSSLIFLVAIVPSDFFSFNSYVHFPCVSVHTMVLLFPRSTSLRVHLFFISSLISTSLLSAVNIFGTSESPL